MRMNRGLTQASVALGLLLVAGVLARPGSHTFGRKLTSRASSVTEARKLQQIGVTAAQFPIGLTTSEAIDADVRLVSSNPASVVGPDGYFSLGEGSYLSTGYGIASMDTGLAAAIKFRLTGTLESQYIVAVAGNVTAATVSLATDGSGALCWALADPEQSVTTACYTGVTVTRNQWVTAGLIVGPDGAALLSLQRGAGAFTFESASFPAAALYERSASRTVIGFNPDDDSTTRMDVLGFALFDDAVGLEAGGAVDETTAATWQSDFVAKVADLAPLTGAPVVHRASLPQSLFVAGEPAGVETYHLSGWSGSASQSAISVGEATAPRGYRFEQNGYLDTQYTPRASDRTGSPNTISVSRTGGFAFAAKFRLGQAVDGILDVTLFSVYDDNSDRRIRVGLSSGALAIELPTANAGVFANVLFSSMISDDASCIATAEAAIQDVPGECYLLDPNGAGIEANVDSWYTVGIRVFGNQLQVAFDDGNSVKYSSTGMGLKFVMQSLQNVEEGTLPSLATLAFSQGGFTLGSIHNDANLDDKEFRDINQFLGTIAAAVMYDSPLTEAEALAAFEAVRAVDATLPAIVAQRAAAPIDLKLVTTLTSRSMALLNRNGGPFVDTAVSVLRFGPQTGYIQSAVSTLLLEDNFGFTFSWKGRFTAAFTGGERIFSCTGEGAEPLELIGQANGRLAVVIGDRTIAMPATIDGVAAPVVPDTTGNTYTTVSVRLVGQTLSVYYGNARTVDPAFVVELKSLEYISNRANVRCSYGSSNDGSNRASYDVLGAAFLDSPVIDFLKAGDEKDNVAEDVIDRIFNLRPTMAVQRITYPNDLFVGGPTVVTPITINEVDGDGDGASIDATGLYQQFRNGGTGGGYAETAAFDTLVRNYTGFSAVFKIRFPDLAGGTTQSDERIWEFGQEGNTDLLGFSLRRNAATNNLILGLGGGPSITAGSWRTNQFGSAPQTNFGAFNYAVNNASLTPARPNRNTGWITFGVRFKINSLTVYRDLTNRTIPVANLIPIVRNNFIFRLAKGVLDPAYTSATRLDVLGGAVYTGPLEDAEFNQMYRNIYLLEEAPPLNVLALPPQMRFDGEDGYPEIIPTISKFPENRFINSEDIRGILPGVVNWDNDGYNGRPNFNGPKRIFYRCGTYDGTYGIPSVTSENQLAASPISLFNSMQRKGFAFAIKFRHRGQAPRDEAIFSLGNRDAPDGLTIALKVKTSVGPIPGTPGAQNNNYILEIGNGETSYEFSLFELLGGFAANPSVYDKPDLEYSTIGVRVRVENGIPMVHVRHGSMTEEYAEIPGKMGISGEQPLPDMSFLQARRGVTPHLCAHATEPSLPSANIDVLGMALIDAGLDDTNWQVLFDEVDKLEDEYPADDFCAGTEFTAPPSKDPKTLTPNQREVRRVAWKHDADKRLIVDLETDVAVTLRNVYVPENYVDIKSPVGNSNGFSITFFARKFNDLSDAGVFFTRGAEGKRLPQLRWSSDNGALEVVISDSEQNDGAEYITTAPVSALVPTSSFGFYTVIVEGVNVRIYFSEIGGDLQLVSTSDYEVANPESFDFGNFRAYFKDVESYTNPNTRLLNMRFWDLVLTQDEMEKLAREEPCYMRNRKTYRGGPEPGNAERPWLPEQRYKEAQE